MRVLPMRMDRKGCSTEEHAERIGKASMEERSKLKRMHRLQALLIGL